MPLNASSYFAGVATVVATMTLGFGGGMLMTDALVGKSDNPPTLVERRAAPLSEAAPAAPPVATPQLETASVPAQPPALSLTQQQRDRLDEAMAKARDDDVKKAVAAEHRKAERRKWAERRKQELKKIEELHAIAERVKDAERERGPIVRSFVAQSRGINLIGDD